MTVGTAGIAQTAAPFFGAVQSRAKAQVTTGNASAASSATGDNSLSTNNLGSTFLSLLVQELQNQDPTQPMDPTQEVGQLISLNQLNQLIGINQDLTSATTAATATVSTGSGAKADTTPPTSFGAAQTASQAANQTAAQTAGTAAPAASDPVTAALAAQGLAPAPASANNAAPLDLGKLNTLFGGK